MQGNNPFSNVLSQIQSRDDLIKVLDELSILKNSLYQTKENTFDQVLKTQVREKIAHEIDAVLVANSDKAGVIKELTRQIESLKTLELTLGFEPTKETIQKIFAWVRTNLGEGIVVGTKYDPDIVGGVLISFNGKYADLSLKKAIDKHLAGLKTGALPKEQDDEKNIQQENQKI